VLSFRDRDLGSAVKLASPFYLSALAVQTRGVVSVLLLGSMLPAGGVSALIYATRIVQYITNGVFSHITTVAYPSLVVRAAESLEGMRAQMVRVLRMFNDLAFPFLAWLLVFSQDVVRIVFYRGEFTERDVHNVTLALTILAIGLIPKGLEDVLGSALYALRRTGWINVFRVVTQFVAIALSLVLFPFFGLGGLAAAEASITTLLVVLQALCLSRHCAVADLMADRASLKAVGFALIGGTVAYGLQRVLPEMASASWGVADAWRVIVASLLAGTVYVGLSLYFRIAELGVITAYLSRRFQVARLRATMLG
jgi:putative peptidoglycan lipid II flippase